MVEQKNGRIDENTKQQRTKTSDIHAHGTAQDDEYNKNRYQNCTTTNHAKQEQVPKQNKRTKSPKRDIIIHRTGHVTTTAGENEWKMEQHGESIAENVEPCPQHSTL